MTAKRNQIAEKAGKRSAIKLAVSIKPNKVASKLPNARPAYWHNAVMSAYKLNSTPGIARAVFGPDSDFNARRP
jgi:hypothetical protein